MKPYRTTSPHPTAHAGLPFPMIVLSFFLLHWYLAIFMQSFFLHRYAAHQMFTMNRRWEKFFYLLTFIGQGASFLSPRAYGIMHRPHHAHSDTEQDPHSPDFAAHILDQMERTAVYYGEIQKRRTLLEIIVKIQYESLS